MSIFSEMFESKASADTLGSKLPTQQMEFKTYPLNAPNLRDPDDMVTMRQRIYDKVRSGVAQKFPIENNAVRLEIKNLRWGPVPDSSLKAQKRALLHRGSLQRRLKGTVRLTDVNTGDVLEEKNMTVANVPHLTQRGTLLYRGNDYIGRNQIRLRPGSYVRKRESGETEAHFNILPGEGKAFRVRMEPKTGVMHIIIGNSKRPIFPLLQKMGFNRTELNDLFGELYTVNAESGKTADLDAIAQRFGTTPEELPSTLASFRLDPFVTANTLNVPTDKVDKLTLARAIQRVMAVNKGVELPDSRDSVAYQTFHSPDDFFQERVLKDAGRAQRKILGRLSRTKSMKSLPSGFLTQQVHSAMLKSGLFSPLEEINPLELKDLRTAVTRLGEGGIPSVDSIPDEARDVQPSYLGVIDPYRGPECHDDKTEVLVRNSNEEAVWKSISQLTMGDWLWCRSKYEEEDAPAYWAQPDRVIHENYCGQMVEVINDEVSFFVTLDHKLWAKRSENSTSPSTRWAHRIVGQFFMVQTFDGDSLLPKELADQRNYSWCKIKPTESRRVHYDGMVHCAKVMGHLFFVRRDGRKGHWSGNSEKIGVDLRLAINTKIGDDGQVYSKALDARTGEEQFVSAIQLAHSNVAFPDEMDKPGKYVRGVNAEGKMDYIKKDDVDFVIPTGQEIFNFHSNLIPMIGANKGGRIFKGAKLPNQALPLESPEAPLVQPLSADGSDTFHRLAGVDAGAIKAPKGGKVLKVTPDYIETMEGGRKQRYDLYNYFPYNRKTAIHNTPLVEPGDTFKPGQVLARSNFTTPDGTLAIGKNLKIGVLPYKGNYEDAVVISESAAKKMRSQHMYKAGLDAEDDLSISKDDFISRFPTKYTREQLSNMDSQGVIKEGARVNPGDPLVLALRRRKADAMHKGYKKRFYDSAQEWEHDDVGVVTDVVREKNGSVRVNVLSHAPMKEADKYVGWYSNKGTVSKIIPDSQMLKDASGKPYDMVVNTTTGLTRGNPPMYYEMALGKIAEKIGKPVAVPAFKSDQAFQEWISDKLAEHGMTEKDIVEEAFDPETNQRIPGVWSGPSYIMKLHHTAESKSSARDLGGYTSEGDPARGGSDGAKRVGMMAMTSLLSHGVDDVVWDAKNIRGAKNEDFWRAYTLGKPLPAPEVPFVFKKFINSLRASGINVDREGNNFHIFALRDQDVDKMSSGEIKSSATVDPATLEPIPGGLFDEDVTGGHNGDQWGHVTLPEPLPNPVMEEPVRRLLGLTKKELEDTLAGKREIEGLRGGHAVARALERINIPKMMQRVEQDVKERRGAARDDAIKKLGYLRMMASRGIKPNELMMTKFPILPTNFRPIMMMDDRIQVDSPNALYKDLIDSRNAYEELQTAVGMEAAREDLPGIYKAMKAVTGLGDPVGTRFEDVKLKGLLSRVFGDSPKYGLFQRKLLGTSVDVSARAAATPNIDLDMDHVGIPEETAWKLYGKIVQRNLVLNGMKPLEAAQAVKDESGVARKALVEEMGKRPVIINRAPDLWKYNSMAAFPILHKGKTLQVSPPIVTGFNLDFDGDAMNYYVPVTEKARRQAIEKMLPSKNLFSSRDYGLMYKPRQEYMLGLYLGTRKQSSKPPVRFRSEEEAVAAFKRGEIGPNDPVIIR